jgi:hypothetical protein
MCIALRRATPPVVTYPGWRAVRDLIRRDYLCPPRSRLRLPRGNAAGMSDSGPPDDRGAIGALTDPPHSFSASRRTGGANAPTRRSSRSACLDRRQLTANRGDVAAARGYFHTIPNALSWPEAATLAGAPTGSLCLRSSAVLLCRQAATTPRARSARRQPRPDPCTGEFRVSQVTASA